MKKIFSQNKSSAFTLIELLVVIAILAILATVIVVIINPGELLKQSRDTDRMADLASLNKAIGLLLVDQVNVSIGTSTKIYISIPDSSPTCANLGLPNPPTGYSYACAATSTYRKVDGTGWIPVNLTSLSTGSPLSSLPVDPINTTSTNAYYMYVPSAINTWDITSFIESRKYVQTTAKADMGYDPERYEIGSDMSLWRSVNGLVGYWKFDDGSGTNAVDSSGNNYTLGASGGTPTWLTSANCKLNGCVSLASSTSQNFSATNLTALNFGTGDFSLLAWVNATKRADGLGFTFFGNYAHSGQYGDLNVNNTDGGAMNFGVSHLPYPAGAYQNCYIDFTPYFSNWHFVSVVRRTNTLYIFVDGAQITSCDASLYNVNLLSSQWYVNGGGWRESDLRIDDHRIYNRGLSNAEILAIYNTTR